MENDKLTTIPKTVEELLQENEQLKKNIAEFEAQRTRLGQMIWQQRGEIETFGAFFVTLLQVYRELQPIQGRVKQFLVKYEMDKIDENIKDKKERGLDVTGKMSVPLWLGKYSFSFLQIYKEGKEMIAEFEPMVKSDLISDYFNTFKDSLGVLYKHISPNLNESEKEWFLSLINKNKQIEENGIQ